MLMNCKQITLSLLLALAATTYGFAQQPYGGCWHPDDIKDWTPEKFADNKFNKAKVPLAKRFKEPTLMKANANQWYEGQVCNSTILFPMCSMSPSQGAYNFLGYQPTYWQYMDKLVYWAGSASEGIINCPPAGSIDAAHAQGVKVLGNIFFPPGLFGGDQAWVRQMLTKENGVYIYAKKLYEIAKYMGFDGWFINEESGGGDDSEWAEFIKQFNQFADADGQTQMEIQWYDASHKPNSTILKSHINTSQFLEYGAVDDHREDASEIGCTEEQTFSKLYGGIQCVNRGLTGYGDLLRDAFPTTGHVGSVDLFCPEERAWKDEVKNLLGKNDTGSQAYQAVKNVFNNEEQVWVNYSGDPSTISRGDWPGFSGCILERSVISSMPFVSNMSVGVGKHRFVKGKAVSTQDWYHSGMQSILPTWRWWIENKGNLKVTIDWDDAWNVASSFKIAGTLTQGDHLMRLYKTEIPVTAGGVLKVVYKGAAQSTVEAKLSTTSSTTPDVTLSEPTVTTENGWTIANYDLSSLNGKTVYMIALNLKAGAEVSNFSMNLGEVAVLPANYTPAALEVSNLATKSVLGESKGDLRLTWDYTYNNDFDHFDIYTVTADGTRKLVGQTRDEAFYVPTFERNGLDDYVNVELVPVMKDMSEGAKQTLKVEYPKATAPKVTFELGKSYLKVGETTTLRAKATGNPTAWKWTLPEGLQLTKGDLTSETITVKALKEGKQEVSVDVTNAIGTSTTKQVVVDVMSPSDIETVTNVVRNKTVVDYSGSTNTREKPTNIIDGVTNPESTSDKWCNISTDNWAIFDCQNTYRIYGFRIYDGNSGPESGVDQIDSYQIMLSNDGKTWTTVVDKEGQANVSIKTDYIPPMNARYVKLVPHVNGTLRIWEFEVYGMAETHMTLSVEPKELKLNAGETKNVVVTYNLNGDDREKNFTCTVAGGSNIKVGTVTENQKNSTFTIPITANKIIAEDKIEITLMNGGATKNIIVPVAIAANDRPNVLSGLKATVRRYNADYSFEAKYDTFETSKLTDGDTSTEALDMIETPSTHKNDLWTIFEAPNGGTWDLSMVKIYLPNANKGTNDNGTEGYVNNSISIAVGNDLNNMTTVKEFSNLQEVSELDYIFPRYQHTKYLAVYGTLNSYFYPSMAEVQAYEQYDENVSLLFPVEVEGFNADVIAEASPAADHSTEGLDDQGWVFYTQDVQVKGAIAGNDRIVKTASGTEFQLAPYNGNNALKIVDDDDKDGDEDEGKYATLTLKTPVNAEEVHILEMSAKNYTFFSLGANYEDGTHAEEQEFTAEDWYGKKPDGDEAVYGLGRMIRTGRDGYAADQIDDRYKFRLYEHVLPLDKSKKLKSISVYKEKSWDDSYLIVLGVTVKGVKLATGINGVTIEGGNNVVVGIYTLNGMKLSKPQKGINIIKYADGTCRKVIVK